MIPIHDHFTLEIICQFRLVPSDQSDGLGMIPFHVHCTSHQSGGLGLNPIHVHFISKKSGGLRLIQIHVNFTRELIS